MRWLKAIFRSGSAYQAGPRSPSFVGASNGAVKRRREERPYDYVSRGLEAWHAEDFGRAEQLLRKGIDAYRNHDADGVDFAIGRLGAFLLARERVDEAAQVLNEAISLGTDIPAIWADYLEIMARRRDVDGLFDIKLRSLAHIGDTEPPWGGLLTYARRADRAGESEFALAIANRVASSASVAGDLGSHWTAIGVLGHIQERAGQLDQALALWLAAFDEGSDDPTTANRLSMHLERARNYSGAIDIIEAALDRHLPANIEEQIRKRLERCRARVEGRKRRDVPAFSVRTGEGAFKPLFQARVIPSIRAASIQGSFARCFGVSKGIGTIVDLALADGSEVGRYTDLPAFGDIQFSAAGWGLGTVRTGRIGDGVTRLTFLSPDVSVAAVDEVPDAVSEIAAGPDLWYVGCRDGRLYAFRNSGELVWQWETPRSPTHQDGATTRPCPYHVASDGEGAVISSMGDLFCISSSGATKWRFELPNIEATDQTVSIPLSDAPSLAHTTSEFKSDRAADEGATSIEISIAFEGLAPTVSYLSATGDSTFVGSSDGRLLVLSSAGRVQDEFALGEGWARPVLSAEGALVGAWCDGRVFYRERAGFRGIAEIPSPPGGIGPFSDGLYYWNRNRLEVVSRSGEVIWSVEFSKNINDAKADQDSLICFTGVLNAFRRAPEAKAN